MSRQNTVPDTFPSRYSYIPSTFRELQTLSFGQRHTASAMSQIPDPPEAQTLEERAYEAFDRGELDEASRLFAELAAQQPTLSYLHYMLGLTSPLADNVSANVVGLFAGSALRFAAYRWWVFAERPQRAPAQSATTAKVTTTVAPTP